MALKKLFSCKICKVKLIENNSRYRKVRIKNPYVEIGMGLFWLREDWMDLCFISNGIKNIDRALKGPVFCYKSYSKAIYI